MEICKVCVLYLKSEFAEHAWSDHLLISWFRKNFEQALILVYKSIHNQAPNFNWQMFILRNSEYSPWGNPETLSPGAKTTYKPAHGLPLQTTPQIE